MQLQNAMPSAKDILALRVQPDNERLEGTCQHTHDHAVVAGLKNAWQLRQDSEFVMEVGVRNMQGDIYRRAVLRGREQMLYFQKWMSALGFVIEFEEQEYPGSGFDVLFR